MVSRGLSPVADPLKLLFSFQQRATAEMPEKELVTLLSVNKNEWHAGGKGITQVHAGDSRILRGCCSQVVG